MSAITPAPSSGAPAKAENLKVMTSGDKLDFDLTFTIPKVTYGASSLSGNIGYEVIIDGETVKTGSGEAGSNVIITSRLSCQIHPEIQKRVQCVNGSV